MHTDALTFTDQRQQSCDYCGGGLQASETNCPSCGARLGKPTDLPDLLASPSIKFALTGLFVWFFLGLLGGYAYWSGQKVKAYARVALWLSTIGWISIGAAAKSNGVDSSGFIVFPFFATILLLIILWAFDLTHLMKKLKSVP